MGWTSTVVWIKVDGDSYWELRPDPDDPTTKQEKRRRYVIIREARGLNLLTAEGLLDTVPVTYANGTLTCSIRLGDGGQWTATKTLDYYSGGWVKGAGAP